MDDTIVTRADILKKIGATMSDSASTQKKTNRLLLDLVVDAIVAEDASNEERTKIREELRSFYCWLHKPINMVKATTKALTEGFERDASVFNQLQVGGNDTYLT